MATLRVRTVLGTVTQLAGGELLRLGVVEERRQ